MKISKLERDLESDYIGRTELKNEDYFRFSDEGGFVCF